MRFSPAISCCSYSAMWRLSSGSRERYSSLPVPAAKDADASASRTRIRRASISFLASASASSIAARIGPMRSLSVLWSRSGERTLNGFFNTSSKPLHSSMLALAAEQARFPSPACKLKKGSGWGATRFGTVSLKSRGTGRFKGSGAPSPL